MEIRLFEYALEIYKTKSFTRAASNLHIAQPSLSKQIAKLESELGVFLFDRKPGSPVELTPDGLVLIKQAERILQMRDDLKQEILERKEGIRVELKIGSTAYGRTYFASASEKLSSTVSKCAHSFNRRINR
ncbi:transcriptional regulator, LysR family/ LysR substrate binding domain protein [Neobacillus bataviensis LMG 21833]|uniref:Transcriptional regulator, LysR family/ LysR substrate binding domain protein n=1 Tax=Neobacillus bataviensis LMG 21833 TaxID=1117379 RepID=K6DCX5_9BACI|nr:LysR family transcriptional regulator [Neobacillus bataviensis]EKN66154.1 transcriptional regulator, LysR family/ LysR substrate binding domain protein [Neobacillus bataviensis LMG 21833]